MGYAAALSVVLFLVSLVLAVVVFRWARGWVYYEAEKPRWRPPTTDAQAAVAARRPSRAAGSAAIPGPRGRAAGGPHRRRDPVHGAALLDGRQRAQDAAGADDVPADARSRDARLAELPRRRQLHPVLHVRAQLADHHAGHHDRRGALQYARGLRLLADRLARPRQALLRLPGHDLPAVSGDPGGPVRHLRQAAGLRDPGLRSRGSTRSCR